MLNNDWMQIINGMIGALIVVVPATFIAVRKLRPETRNIDSDTAKKWQEIADRAAEREKELLIRVERLERVMNTQKYEVRVVFTGGEFPRVDEALARHVLVGKTNK